jgi:hypothetical protein
MTISIDAGRATCCRCGQPIEPGEPGDLGHSPDRTRYSRPPASALQSCDVLGSTEADAVRIELEASPRLLRSRCARAAIRLWRSDRSRSGLVVRRQTDLEQNGVIFPKLFRRLTEYLRRQGGAVRVSALA